ncbi:MAG: AAA family ATPase [Methanobrevibacter arboriphilus]|uniref:AAA family ATPase n=1 Tax=Methanobrevibacter arboriphilus TaxID=39441 RepID=A0A843AGX3_METAZ|nr:AAA family ATPase [Methanobrevibacter arboriphilus]MBF4468366.1 AAA family ATPase [Methanobrevibacter arboriphilus]
MKTVENIFEAVIQQEGTLFKQPEVFTLEYLPEILRFREKQLRAMINHSRTLNNDHAPTNMEITGPYGTGKTTAVKKYFELIENKFNVATAYINCEFDKTENQMLTKIYNKLYKKNVKTGVTTNILKNKIVNYLGKTEKVLVVCLDDYGSNKISGDDIDQINKVMYTLLRAHEIDHKAKISLITITNRRYINFVLSQSVETIFRPVNVNFDAYTLNEINIILSDRCELGFARGVISEEVIYMVAEHAYREGDLRIGIRCLYDAGRNAELVGSSTIEREHLDF